MFPKHDNSTTPSENVKLIPFSGRFRDASDGSDSQKVSSIVSPLPSQLIGSPKPVLVTLDLLFILDKPVEPISHQGIGPRQDLKMDVNRLVVGQEGEAPPPDLLLALGPPLSDAEFEATTLILGPPGTEKEAIKKAKLDLRLKL